MSCHYEPIINITWSEDM